MWLVFMVLQEAGKECSLLAPPLNPVKVKGLVMNDKSGQRFGRRIWVLALLVFAAMC